MLDEAGVSARRALSEHPRVVKKRASGLRLVLNLKLKASQLEQAADQSPPQASDVRDTPEASVDLGEFLNMQTTTPPTTSPTPR
jgi:hypothetical protein